jgi:molybdate transport system permease protein
MQKINHFKNLVIFASLFITLVLLIAVASFFLVPEWKDVVANIQSKEMLFSLKLSLWTGLLSTFLVLVFAIPIGFALSRFDFPGKGIAKTIIDLPVAFPELVLGLSLLLLFGNTPFGKFLKALGLDFVFTQKGVVAAQFFTALPYSIRILKSTFDYINPRLEFVSRSLGYSQFETFRKVSLPLAKNGLIASTVISFARCIGTFGTVLILAGGSAGTTNTLPITLYLNISYGNMGMALTSGIILITVSFLAIFVFEKTEAHI